VLRSWRCFSLIGIAFVTLGVSGPASSGPSIAHERQTIRVDGAVSALAFSPDAKLLAIASLHGTVIWDLATGRIAQHLNSVADHLGAQVVNFSPDARYLAICGWGEGHTIDTILIYDTKTWQLSHAIDHETGNGIDTGKACTGVLFSPDGKLLVRLTNQFAEGAEYNVVLYDTSSWRVASAIRTTSLQKGTDTDSIRPPGRLVLQTRDSPADIEFTVDEGQAFFSKSGQYLALGGHKVARATNVPQIWILEMPAGDLLRSLEVPTHSISWGPAGRRIAVGGNGKVVVLDADSGTILITQDSQIHCIEFGCAQGTTNGRELVAFSPDGRFLIEAIDRQVEVWNGEHTKKWQSIPAVPWCMAVSPDSRFLALGGEPKSVLPLLVDLAVHPRGAGGKVILYEIK
jgi:WD40 repeat protein